MRALALMGGLMTVALIASATHDEAWCDGYGALALGIVQITPGWASETFYLDERDGPDGPQTFLYQEWNGVWSEKDAGVYVGDPEHADLQRGSGCEPIYPTCHPEYCTDGDLHGPDYQIY
jgi:hypothetical protein